mmetsp:Transcript_110007/g.320204  ORF Transcript_110007/g.320204 Transcript_110007/m.320204 type:complete len:210 (+) Transcript_110007:75-704(+)
MAKSMSLNMASGTSGMLKSGHKSIEGLDEAVLKNIEAAKGIAQIVSSSMGPNGMNKLVVNHLSKIIVSSDCATLIQELEVQHPAAKMLALAAEMQDQEFGDATNLCVTFAGELLKLSEQLLISGVHQSEIVAGFKVAFDKTLEVLPTLVCHTVEDPRDRAALEVSQRGSERIREDENNDTTGTPSQARTHDPATPVTTHAATPQSCRLR